jgi:molybdopterin-synthase adenylyltransferase
MVSGGEAAFRAARMTTIALVQSEFECLVSLASTERLETAAVGLVFEAPDRQNVPRRVVRAFAPVPDSAYVTREPDCLTLAPEFCMNLANRARALGCGIILAHTHPSGLAGFSATDDAGETPLAEYFGRRAAGHDHFSLVVTKSASRCRELGSRGAVDVQIVGSTARIIDASQSGAVAEPLPRFDRQVRAFGPEAQATLSKLRVAIVGLGGTGSFVCQELAHLGVNAFTLIDPDQVDETNLNRLLGASPLETRELKVNVAARRITTINPDANCETIAGDVVDEDVAPLLLGMDFIFCCTDSHASRALLNQIAYQYLIPCIDMGVAIYANAGTVTRVAGRVQMLSPGLPCLICANWLDSNQVRIEMLTSEQRRQDPYFIGHSVPHPAVISLNGTVSSAAVTMFLSAVAGFPSDARMLIYDGIRGAMRPTIMTPDANCIVCSQSGALARGTSWALPIRTYAVD